MGNEDEIRKLRHVMDGLLSGAESKAETERPESVGGNLTINGPININHGQQQSGNQIGPPVEPCAPAKSSFPIMWTGLAIFLLLVVWAIYLVNRNSAEELSVKQISQQTAEKTVKQYEMASQLGDATSICVQAMTVAGWYLQAQDSANYAHWKAIEKADCQRAGSR